MLLSFGYLVFSTLLRWLVRGRRSEFPKDVELLVLRHQLLVLRRRQPRPSFRAPDRGGTNAGAAAQRPKLTRVPPPAGGKRAGVRLLHRRDDHAAPLLSPDPPMGLPGRGGIGRAG